MPRYLEDPSPALITKKTLSQKIEDRFNKASAAAGFGLPKLPPGGTPTMTKSYTPSVPSLDEMFSGKKRAKVVTGAVRG